MASIFVVDDDQQICMLFERILHQAGHGVVFASDGSQLVNLLEADLPELILLDVNLPDAQGYELVPRILEFDPFIKVVLISGEMTVEAAMAAVKMGAFDYLSKPFTRQSLLHAVNQALEARRLAIHNTASERVQAHAQPYSINRLIGSSRAICTVNVILDRLAKASNSPILLSGPMGTPKAHAARAIHEMSDRSDKPFYALNCTAVPRPLMHSELFGQPEAADFRKRLGLLHLARGGTLYLSEVEALTKPTAQELAFYLEAIQNASESGEPPVSTRLLFSTSVDLEMKVQLGEFCPSLWEHLEPFNVRIPRLESHLDDLQELASHYLQKICSELGRPLLALSGDVYRNLREYTWPGNHAELHNLLERVSLLAPLDQQIVDMGLFERVFFMDSTPASNSYSLHDTDHDANAGEVLNDFFEPVPLTWVEKEYIQKVLIHSGYDLPKTAQQLGISLSALQRKIALHDLTPLLRRVANPD
ncbi:MAG: sigma-54 dependent transcriptional regulator [Candidatus Sumerlaeia bacterium]|nr:sigma-54 dependent transcriptional regulator [Candidatus Sumerlaeia bacterium]